jgi:hypothetical protein
MLSKNRLTWLSGGCQWLLIAHLILKKIRENFDAGRISEFFNSLRQQQTSVVHAISTNISVRRCGRVRWPNIIGAARV